MGTSHPKKQTEEEQTEHERLGHVKLQLNQYNTQNQEEDEETFTMHLRRSVESEKIYNQWVKSMTQINDSQSKEVILLPSKYSFESVGMCGSSGICKLSYDYYEFVLKTQILNRNRLRKDFLQTQVWYLLYNIVRAGSKFQHLRKKIGNVHPMNILINQSGQIKIISTVSLPGQINNYDSLLEQQNSQQYQNVFLAPEQINRDYIQKGAYPENVDPSLAEVFSIGLTILSSGTLQDCDTIYSQSPYQIRKDRLNGLLKIFKDKYSDYLYQTVASMLSLNPQDRKRCSTIAGALYEYEPQILDLEPFQAHNHRVSQRPSYGQGYQQSSQVNHPPPPPTQPLYFQSSQHGSQHGPAVRSTYQMGQPINQGGNMGYHSSYQNRHM